MARLTIYEKCPPLERPSSSDNRQYLAFSLLWVLPALSLTRQQDFTSTLLWLCGASLLGLLLTSLVYYLHKNRAVSCYLQDDPLCLITEVHWLKRFGQPKTKHLPKMDHVRVLGGPGYRCLTIELVTPDYQTWPINYYRNDQLEAALAQCQQIADFLQIHNAKELLFDHNGQKISSLTNTSSHH